MGIKVIRLRHKTPPQAGSCRWCGVPKQDHGNQWVPGHAWHTFVQPTQEQIKARMQAHLNVVRFHLPYREPTS